jgi:DNA-binding MarR family transcriptional regulator
MKKIYSFEFWAVPKFIQLNKKLTQTDKMVLSVLITRMNGENFSKVKQKTIADDLLFTVSMISKSIRKLEKLGYITNTQLGKTLCNQYEVKLLGK